MRNRNALVLMRAFYLLFIAIAAQHTANAATYSNIQEVIENESLILGYDSEAIDGLSVPPTFVLEKNENDDWFINASVYLVEYSPAQKLAVNLQVDNTDLVQTYKRGHISSPVLSLDITEPGFAEKWGQDVADQLVAALDQGILITPSVTFQTEVEVIQVSISPVLFAENEMTVDIATQTKERLHIPQNVIDYLDGGWIGSTQPEYAGNKVERGIKLKFGITSSPVPELSEKFISLPFIANYTNYWGSEHHGYFQDLFWNSVNASSTTSTVLEQNYSLLTDAEGLTLSINGNTFSYSFLEQINDSAWTVLVNGQMADGTEYLFADEMVIVDSSAGDFASQLVTTFPFIQMSGIAAKTTADFDENGQRKCENIVASLFNNDGTYTRTIFCEDEHLYHFNQTKAWELTATGIEMDMLRADGIAGSFESQIRYWIPLITDEDGTTWVIEYIVARLNGNHVSGFFLNSRLNYIGRENLSDYTEMYRNGGLDGDNDGDGYADSEDDDDDNDGMPDEYEAAHGLNHLDGNDAAFDKDGDGLTNYSEFEQGTSPANADTDGDGVIDSVDGYPLDALRTDSTADLFSFSYTFDANERGTAGHILQGIVEGYLMDDNDTIVISNLVSASLGGYDYVVTSDAAVRAADPADTPRMSLSGDELDFWVCVQGFTYTYDNGGGDCAFGPEGGFLISYYVDSNNGNCLEFSGSDCSVWAWAGIPDLGDSYRDGDIPVNRNNWSATTYSTTRVRNDVDGDGKSDLLWRSYAKGWNFLWTMDGAFMSSATPINVVASNEWDMVGQGDYDADGKSDIFWRNNTSGQNFVYLMDGPSIKSRYSLNYVTGGSWIVAGSGDFDGDGTGDVIWRNTARGDTWFYLMDSGYIGQSLPSLWVTDLNYQIAAVGDIDGDGDDDIIWRHNGNGVNYIWLMEGGAISSRYTLNTVNTQWSIAGAGDLDGDGTDDLIFRNQVDGENWVYYMDNGQVRESRFINTVADTNWQIANIGDYDGDGKVDFLWRDETTARNIIHLMNGTSIKGRGVLRNTNNTWRVAR